MQAKIIYCTTPDKEVALSISRRIIQARLAACVSIVPGVTSVFNWDGQLQEETEFLMIIKSLEPAMPHLLDKIKEFHPYDTPELIVTDISAIDEKYLKWMESNIELG